ncbi:phospho-N-acetylmuramoyl-pentapeptide-transferase [Tenacibaculum maritimum]|uniref:Phospho-N-acetylmuramoyl-pentapeptide-transferase n=1 Tax=Tenacibaculum maritimum NCIMB 2154 TaxID=1349785 RepID=A0A2H1E6X2_9FLAO|nr:phospho-N-acetylmuramoyl-pentapeptide-transferase [Tenacibaculum maritimum]MCD9563724.1 phospho-N-acetylmuramoyl-pentapeptide-transferase [Tenacibaculum maritimum]MCD9566330.1 phospho-N-acetylmuramoyl-pentapeptide-transferase [Tenacibaculum maritimum]MCD9579691.1 phospho-N-acetylmuramoyl-pentapeptide-transferase [Tenacibaculum maritimum]MCD9584979.1 phospho-N-acetylmuramoyl-pentapeptide-transferase [Tenacibaculum maritimum]MCD9596889.1 phospho-N-acetylmuramoyl-pentapeptide-transferase [Tena
MLYYLFQYLEGQFNLTGASVFQFITFRAATAFIVSLLISTVFGKRIINYLRKQQVGETIRDLGLEGQVQKSGTPTMGGVIIILATLVPVLLLAKLENIYIVILLITTLWMGMIGFADDYIKVFKKDKGGLKGKFKVLGQVGLGIIVGSMLYFHPDVTMKEQLPVAEQVVQKDGKKKMFGEAHKSTKTTVPFLKGNELDYAKALSFLGENYRSYGWIVFIFVVVFIVTGISNGANLTDGIDGLAAGTSAIMVMALAIFAWVSGNIIFADYLDVMYIPSSGEMTVFILAFAGALIGFLWYNTYPAQVFMGDTGSLTIGGIIAVIAIAIRKELLLPILAGVFVVENLSVMLQVSYFKYTKKKFGEGRRIFKMSPLHHHYQKLNYHESKIVTRFWIVGILLAVFAIVTLKLR